MEKIKHIGSGIGFRPELKTYIFLHRDKIDFVEIIADHYIDVPKWKLHELELLREHFTVIPHAINLSVGSAKGMDRVYLDKLKKLIDYLEPPYWSEHISYTKAHGTDVGHLSPIIYNNSFLGVLQCNISRIRDKITCPLILENITYHVELPGREFSDTAFLNTLCKATGTGLLLDLTNLYINSRNFNFDPYAFIDQLDKENIVQLHYVGYDDNPWQLVDSHAQQTQPEVFDLMEYLMEKHMPAAVLLERDEQFEKKEEITADLFRAKQIIKNFNYVHH